MSAGASRVASTGVRGLGLPARVAGLPARVAGLPARVAGLPARVAGLRIPVPVILPGEPDLSTLADLVKSDRDVLEVPERGEDVDDRNRLGKCLSDELSGTRGENPSERPPSLALQARGRALEHACSLRESGGLRFED